MTTDTDVQLYIGGSWRKTADRLPIINPANEKQSARLRWPPRVTLMTPLPQQNRAFASGAGQRRRNAPKSF